MIRPNFDIVYCIKLILSFTFIFWLFFKALKNVRATKKIVEKDGYNEYKWWEWCLLVPYRKRDAGAKVPIWIFIPVLILSILSILIVLIILVAGTIVIFKT
jgi:hypothetical protein